MTYAGLTISDKPALLDAKARGAEWVARDENGQVFAYSEKPSKGIYFSREWMMRTCKYVFEIEEELLPFIQWSDAEPVNIDLALAQIEEMEKNQVLSEIIDSIENPKPITWNERIKSGNDSEVARAFIAFTKYCHEVESFEECIGTCEECAIRWMHSPYTEGEKV